MEDCPELVDYFSKMDISSGFNQTLKHKSFLPAYQGKYVAMNINSVDINKDEASANKDFHIKNLKKLETFLNDKFKNSCAKDLYDFIRDKNMLGINDPKFNLADYIFIYGKCERISDRLISNYPPEDINICGGFYKDMVFDCFDKANKYSLNEIFINKISINTNWLNEYFVLSN